MTFFRAPEGISSICVGSDQFDVKDGVFEVPDEKEGDFLNLGYIHGPIPEGYQPNPRTSAIEQKEAELEAAQNAFDAEPENEELKKALTKAKAALTKAKNAADDGGNKDKDDA